jgi:hypothetical protein
MTRVAECAPHLCQPWVRELCSIAMKTRLPLLASCLLAFAGQAQDSKVQMWMWKDANGVVHYSDVPGPGAVKVDINVSKGQPGAAPSTPAASSPPAAAAQAVAYTSLTIVQPANDTSYFDADAVVEVQIASEPSLADGDSIFLYLDGKRVGNSGDAQSYSLSNVERGAHTLTAVIFDSQGKERIRSQPVVFYMKQNTIGTPAAMGPAVKPKPRPRPTPQGGG